MKILVYTKSLEDFPYETYYERGVASIRFLNENDPDDYTSGGLFNVELDLPDDRFKEVRALVESDPRNFVYVRVNEYYLGG